MITNEIAFQVGIKSEVLVYAHEIWNCPEFKEGQIVSSMESLAFQLAGHAPLKEFKFSESKLQEWCEDKKIDMAYDQIQQIYHFRKSKK